MIQEAIQELRELFTEAAQAVVDKEKEDKKYNKIDLPSDGRIVSFIQDGKIHYFDVPPALRKHTVGSMDDLIAAAEKLGNGPSIWVSEKEVVLLLDDSDRRERVTLPLVKTAVWRSIEQSRDTPKVTQKTLCGLLRRIFRGAVQAQEMLVGVGNIKFLTTDVGQNIVSSGRESVGRTIAKEAAGVEASIPDCIIVPCDVFLDPAATVKPLAHQITIDVEIDMDAKDGGFILRPYPDQMELAMTASLATIRNYIASSIESDVPVFFGTP